VHEIIAHIRIALSMLKAITEKEYPILVITRQIGTHSKKDTGHPMASLLCISYPHEYYLLQKILDILEPYDVTLSRLEKMGRDILICRITKNEEALTVSERNSLVKKIQSLKKNNE